MATAKAEIPKKPYPEYRLFAHAVGLWAKKIKGKLWYFGVWTTPEEVLRKYLDEADEIQAGRDPRRTSVVEMYSDTISAYDVCNHCLERQQWRADAGEVPRRNVSDNLKACRRFMRHVGKFTRAASLSSPLNYSQPAV